MVDKGSVNIPVVSVGDIWYTPSHGGEREFYELILEDEGYGRFFVLELLTGEKYDTGVGVFRDAVKVG